MKNKTAKEHYDLLISENNDPVEDSAALQKYMDKFDGQLFIDALELKSESSVLEIGVGTGRLARKVLCKGCRSFTGIDFSPATIERAKHNLSQWNNISLILADFLEYQFQQKFDIIYCSLTLFHIENKKAFFRKVSALLNFGGRFVLTISNKPQDLLDYGSRTVTLYPDDIEETKNLLKPAGLKAVKVFNVPLSYIIVAENSRVKFSFLEQEKFAEYSKALFAILEKNMSKIAPTGNSYEDDYKQWSCCTAEALMKESRKLVLIFIENEIIGFFKYNINGNLFEMEDFHLKPEYHGKGQIFRNMYGFVISKLPVNIEFIEANTSKANIKAQGILSRLGLKNIGENKNGRSYRYRGDFSDLLKWYNCKTE